MKLRMLIASILFVTQGLISYAQSDQRKIDPTWSTASMTSISKFALSPNDSVIFDPSYADDRFIIWDAISKDALYSAPRKWKNETWGYLEHHTFIDNSRVLIEGGMSIGSQNFHVYDIEKDQIVDAMKVGSLDMNIEKVAVNDASEKVLFVYTGRATVYDLNLHSFVRTIYPPQNRLFFEGVFLLNSDDVLLHASGSNGAGQYLWRNDDLLLLHDEPVYTATIILTHESDSILVHGSDDMGRDRLIYCDIDSDNNLSFEMALQNIYNILPSDEQGILFCTTLDGLYKYNYWNHTYSKITNLIKGPYKKMEYSSVDNSIIVEYPKLSKYLIDEGVISFYGVPGTNIYSATIEPNSNDVVFNVSNNPRRTLRYNRNSDSYSYPYPYTAPAACDGLMFSANGERLALLDDSVRIYDTNTEALLFTYEYRKLVYNTQFNASRYYTDPNNTYMFWISKDEHILVYDIDRNEVVDSLDYGNPDQMHLSSADSMFTVSGLLYVRYYNMPGFRYYRDSFKHYMVDYSHDDHIAAKTGYKSISGVDRPYISCHSYSSPNDLYGYNQTSIRVFDDIDKPPPGFQNVVEDMRLIANGRYLFVHLRDSIPMLYSTDDMSVKYRFDPGSLNPERYELSPDERLLIGFSRIEDIVVAWDMPDEILSIEYKQVPLAINMDMTVYPNPASTQVLVNYALVKTMPITLQIQDVLGRVVHTAVDGFADPGTHTISISTASYHPGTYFLVMQSGTKRVVKSIVVR